MDDEMVERLRLYSKRMGETRSTVLGLLLSDAADEIERLCELSSNAGKLREERDEARREVCDLSIDPPRYALERGWDCFKEDA